jgi:hypothetical protein
VLNAWVVHMTTWKGASEPLFLSVRHIPAHCMALGRSKLKQPLGSRKTAI